MTNIQEIQLLTFFIQNKDKGGNIDFKDEQTIANFNSLSIQGNELDSYLYDKTLDGTLSYEEIGEEGFAPIIMAATTEKTFPYLQDKIKSVELELKTLNDRITGIFTFSPSKLSTEISATQEAIVKARTEINKSNLLATLNEPLNTISTHFESVKKVSESYEEIYKNIIRPVQEEGKAGVKATVKWAIISLIASALISILISNWNSFFPKS
jgi:hypothetical protein